MKYFSPSTSIEDRVGNGKRKRKRPVKAPPKETPPALPTKRKNVYTYDSPKVRTREEPLPGEENWSFTALEKARKFKLPPGYTPIFNSLPESYNDLQVLPILLDRDPNIIHDLAHPGVHPDYLLVPKPELDPPILAQIKEKMGPCDYKAEPFPHRLFNRRDAFSREVGIPPSGHWFDYFQDATRGYKIDFLEESEIPPRSQQVYPEDPDVTRCLNETIDKLEKMGVCEQNPGNIPCYRENPRFCIASSGSDLRMIIDMSNLAPFIKGKRFKYEDLNAFLLQIEDDSWSWHLDLTKAYYLIEICKNDQRYLGFCYTTLLGVARHMRMKALVMGLNPACEIFTSLDRLVITSFRRDFGAKVYPFLDDTTGNEKTREQAAKTALKACLRRAEIGQVINLEKSTIAPTQCLTTLGYLVRTNGPATIEIAPKRIAKHLARLKTILDRATPIPDDRQIAGGPRIELWGTPREAAQIGGGHTSNSRVIGKGMAALRGRFLYRLAAMGEESGWDTPTLFPYEAINELLLQEAFYNLRNPAIRRLIRGFTPTPLDIKHISDSSATAYGSFLSRYLDFDRAKALIQSSPSDEYTTFQSNLVVQALAILEGDLSTLGLRPLFSSEVFHHLDAKSSSLLRELIPILATIIMHGDRVLRNLTVAFYTDNSGVPNVLKRGSPVPKIHAIAIAIDNALTRFGIQAEWIWVPREEEIMVAADTGSRVTDYHSYHLTREGFSSFFDNPLFPSWPKPVVDLFADRKNFNCAEFFSQSFSEGCSGIDATISVWPADKVLYAFPPIKLIPLVLARALRSYCQIYILTPIWPSSPLFIHLCPDGAHFRPEIRAWRYVDRESLRDGISSSAFFTKKPGKPILGHSRMFVMIYLDTRIDQSVANFNYIPSQFGKKFCLRFHLSGRALCPVCSRYQSNR